MLPVYTPRGPISKSRMIRLVRTFGAPVIDAAGKSAQSNSKSDASLRARTVEVSWRSWSVGVASP